MVKLSLSISAELEEVNNIYAHEHKIWFFKIKCSNCLVVTDSHVGIDPEEQVEQRKDTVNLLMKCKNCGRENSVVIEPLAQSIKEREVESETMFEVARFDCRGLELEEFDPRDNWVVVSSSGKKFEEVDLESDWSEYDESSSASMSVLNIQSSINKVK